MGRNLLSYSGGKDSGASTLVAIERGYPFSLVFADTGNEHPITYDFIHEFAHRLGIKLQTVKAHISKEKFLKKIDTCMAKWLWDGVPPWRIRQAIEVLKTCPTGNPFLDLCLHRGRFPSTRARFCSIELKQEAIFHQAVEPLLSKKLRVISIQGVRADESRDRCNLPERERVGGGLFIWRPIISWNIDDVLAIHRRHNMPLNPLYKMGCSRVGCMPCIHANKEELWNIGWRFPEVIDRIEKWEKKVSDGSKRGVSTFFSVDKIPGPHQKNHNLPMPGIRKVTSWAGTARGGRQFPLFGKEQTECSSVYGLCE